MRLLKPILYILFVVTLWLPMLQMWIGLVHEPPLAGAYTPVTKPQCSAQSWFEGTYQTDFDRYMNDTLGFHKTLVRCRNGFCFMVFRKANAQNVVVGKDRFLFEQDYIDAYYGTDYVGMDTIMDKCRRLYVVQQKLKEEGKTLLVCLAPSKADFYPEKIPNSLRRASTNNTNYNGYSRALREAGVNLVDFNAWFLKNKAASSCPLYPRYGIHWSHYAMLQATDSLVSCIENLHGVRLNHLVIGEPRLFRYPKDEDYDLGNTLNMLGGPMPDPLCYPETHWTSDTALLRPTMLVVADSYYWGPFNAGLQYFCLDGMFWYYNHLSYPNDGEDVLVDDLDRKQIIHNADIILILSTTPGLKRFSWGFLEKLEKMY